MLLIAIPGAMLIAIAFTLGAQFYVSRVFGKWSRVSNGSGLSGREVAAQIKLQTGLQVDVELTEQRAGDLYDPLTHTVRLTEEIADKSSVASLAVVAHELGHAEQHVERAPLIQIRNFMVPAVQIMSPISYVLLAVGALGQMMSVLTLGSIMFSIVVMFMIITLPIEVDASRRGIRLLQECGLMKFEEDMIGSREVLTAAALTYVAATLLSVWQLFRYLLVLRG